MKSDVRLVKGSEGRAPTMADKAPVLLWESAASGVIAVNEFVLAFFGASLDDVRGTGWAQYLHAEDRPGYMAAYHSAFAERAPFTYQGRFRAADGEYRWLATHGAPDGEDHFVMSSTDVTEFVRTQELLQLQLGLAGVGSWTYDPAAQIVSGDETACELFGVREAKTFVVEWLAGVVEEDRPRVTAVFANGLAGQGFDTRYRVRAGDGVRSLHVRATNERTPDGMTRVVGVCRDVTREESLAADLADTADRFATERGVAAVQLRLEGERLAMSLVTSNATSFDWSRASDEVRWSGMPPFGADPETIPTGASSLRYVHPDDRAELAEVLDQAMKHRGSYAYDYRALWSDGSIRWVRTAGRAFEETDGSIRYLGVNSDITDRKLSEEALLHSEKLAAVGRLASVISHEINNPLEAVTNLLYIVRSSPSLTREDREHLELADRELARVSQITAQTLSFHRSVDHPVRIDVDVMVQEILTLYRTRLTASQIRARLDLQEGVSFAAFEGDIRQVLNNLFGNAFDAMRNGGILRVRSRFATDQRTGRKGASISVADNGAGIPEEARSRIFEAFYSTKGMNGTGLGLWISQRILQKHKGSLTFRTSTGTYHGSIFRLWVPLEAGVVMAVQDR